MKKGLWMGVISVMALVILTGMVPAGVSAADSSQTAEFLFVQTAKDVSVDGGKLILKGVSPTVLFFTDRPDRVAGNMHNDRYLKLWTEDGKDSFLADPPNATLSVFAGDTVAELVVTLSNPQFNGDDLTYDINLIKGDPLEKGGACALFIDIIGMPMTPVSYAGARRRMVYRRW